MEVAGAVDDNFPKGSINAQQQAPPGSFHSHLDLVSSLSDSPSTLSPPTIHQRKISCLTSSAHTPSTTILCPCCLSHTTPASLRNPSALHQAMSSQWPFEEIDSADEFEIPPSPSSPLPRQLVSALHQDLKNDDSAGEISSITNTATSGHTMHTGGTSFLDLPLELRIMVYDLAIPNDYRWNFRMPGKPKTVVKGINLLRSCRQVRAEVSNRVWRRLLSIDFNTSSFNMRAATSALNDSALAKIPIVRLSITIDPDALSSCGAIDLTGLSSFKSLSSLVLNIMWMSPKTRKSFEPSIDTTFFTGLVIQTMTQIPRHKPYVYWTLYYYDECDRFQSSDVLEVLARKYKSLRGFAHESQTDNP